MISKEVEPSGHGCTLAVGWREMRRAQDNARFLAPGNANSQLPLTRET